MGFEQLKSCYINDCYDFFGGGGDHSPTVFCIESPIPNSDIEENYDQYDGFVILHGTDTMAYTTSALSFIFSNLTKTGLFPFPFSFLLGGTFHNIKKKRIIILIFF